MIVAKVPGHWVGQAEAGGQILDSQMKTQQKSC
jgi:hypothetical protein